MGEVINIFNSVAYIRREDRKERLAKRIKHNQRVLLDYTIKRYCHEELPTARAQIINGPWKEAR